jgi:hypothetical protein
VADENAGTCRAGWKLVKCRSLFRVEVGDDECTGDTPPDLSTGPSSLTTLLISASSETLSALLSLILCRWAHADRGRQEVRIHIGAFTRISVPGAS